MQSDSHVTKIETTDGSIHWAPPLLATLAVEAQAGYLAKPWGGVELGGLLLGDHEGDAITVLDRVVIDCEHEFGPAFELSDVDRQKLTASLARLESQNSGHKVVGWYRTTSKYLSMTEPDAALADRFFGQPGQFTVIIQRGRNQKPLFGFFRKQPDGVWKYAAEFSIEETTAERETDAVAPADEKAAPKVPEKDPAPAPEAAERVVVPAEMKPNVTERPHLPDREPHLKYFGLKEDPFGFTPDPRYWYPSTTHREAAATLVYGIEARKACISLIGEAGSGKTFVLEYVTDALKAAGIDFAFLLNSHLTVEQFFELLAVDLELPSASYRKVQVLVALQDRLLAAAQRGSTVAIVIDDAHKLSAEVLEEIDLLGNLESRRSKLLQVVLAGQPELEAKLERAGLRSLRQRIALRATLSPLNLAETTAYIHARLQQAGASDLSLFPGPTIQAIWENTLGVPRLINLICSGVLERAFSQNRVMTLELVAEIAYNLRFAEIQNRNNKDVKLDSTTLQ